MSTPRATVPPWVEDILSTCPALLTADEASRVLRCGRRSLGRLIAEGRLIAIRPQPGGSSKLLIPRAELGKYLSSMGAA